MTLSDLKAQFAALANRRDLSANSSLQQTFIDQAVMRIQRELRVPAMEKSLSIVIPSPYTALAIPTDMIELIDIYPAATGAEKLRKCDLSRATQLALTTGTPKEYARENSTWVLGPAPAPGDVIKVDYYAELQPLVNPSDQNVVSVIAWDLIVYAALVQMAIYFKDVRKQDFEDQYETILGGLQAQSDEDDTNGGSEVMPCYVFPLDLTDDN